MSVNFLVEDENQPVVWKGPIISNTVKQFYRDVMWEELDYLLIDMPPGTGDVALTVMQSIPLNGIVMVSVPQDMISMIVAKAVKMAKMLNVNVLGVVENMSYIQCPDCDKKIKLFDGEETEKFLQDMDLQLLGELPMTKEIVNITHKGVNEVSEDLDNILENIVEKIK
jgi:Mrp family chromosome partitioning ATPase